MVVSLHLACLQKIITEIRIDFYKAVYSFLKPLSNVKSPQKRGLSRAGGLDFVAFAEAKQVIFIKGNKIIRVRTGNPVKD
ncbi:MAG: hypothetical protein ACLRVT_00290 [Oscillospiraceae bacterium]